jgi:hypothetical protein
MKVVLWFAILFMPPAWAVGAVYRLPVDPQQSMKLVEPSRPLPPPQTMSITNLYDGGPFNGERIDFKYNSDGTFQRVGTRRFDFLREARFAECEGELTGDFIMNHIIHGSVMKRVDNQALDEMVNRAYIPESKKPEYMEGSHAFDANQMVYLDTTSVMTAEEVKSYFDGKIPWVRISEIIAPRGMTVEKLKQLAEENSPLIQLRLRRATLRLVSGQTLHPTAREIALQLPLPYVQDGSQFHIDYGETPLVFEPGRLSQIVGLHREAQQLVAMATAIAFLQTGIIDVIGRPNYPPDRARLVVQALDDDHRGTYRIIAGFQPIPGAEPYMMQATIPEAMEKLGRGLKHETIKKLVALRTQGKRKANWSDYLYSLAWIQEHRRSHLQIIDVSWDGYLLTREAPILFRPPDKMARMNTMAQILNGPNDIKPYAHEFMDALDEIKDFDFHFKWGSRPDEFVNRDEVWQQYPDDYLISGLVDRLAASDPFYVRKILSAVSKGFNPDVFRDAYLIIAARSPALRSQLAELGEPVDGGYRVSVAKLQIALNADPHRAEIERDLEIDSKGFWYRYWILKHLPGL